MHFHAAALLFSLSAVAIAENTVEQDDVPSVCLQACQFTIDLSYQCDEQSDDDDNYRECVCGAPDSRARLTSCATCVRDNGMSDPDDNDVADLMDDCGWDFDEDDAPYTTGTMTIGPTATDSLPSTTGTTIATETTGLSGPGPTTATQAATATNTEGGVSVTEVPTGGAAGPVAAGIGIIAGVAMAIPILM
ncbi:hypothetical protein F5Y15DRAFT_394022 [Xylariaceae sp. FL0016]|nr:hypothetical protein F5Y15DRAFT_394022 [Xylariaceae sp. FL0016]